MANEPRSKSFGGVASVVGTLGLIAMVSTGCSESIGDGSALPSDRSHPTDANAEGTAGLSAADLKYLSAKYPGFPVDLAFSMEKSRCGDTDKALPSNPYAIAGFERPVRVSVP